MRYVKAVRCVATYNEYYTSTMHFHYFSHVATAGQQVR